MCLLCSDRRLTPLLLDKGLECKTIAVIGATGGVGLETVYQALAAGNKVRALCRSPDKLVIPPGNGGESKAGTTLTSPDLEIIQGDVTKKADVEKLLDDSDIAGVVVALGGRTAEVGKTSDSADANSDDEHAVGPDRTGWVRVSRGGGADADGRHEERD
eukprot:1064159-Rhodomonas_salina.1